MNEIKNACLQAILNSDRDLANQLIDDWVIDHGYDTVLPDILDPILEELGNLWTVQSDITFAQVYVSAKIAEDIIVKVLEHTNIEKASKYKIVIGNIEDDFHSLGRRLVSTFLASSDWDVIDLGNDVTPKEFVDKALEEDAKIIMVSAMMYTTAQNIKLLRQEIDNRGLKNKILLAVGGAVFNLRQDLWQEVGADGSSRNAIEANILAKELLERVGL